MNSSATSADSRWMQDALQLAQLGLGRVEPNPMVGCVLVHDGVRIGAGYHAHFGGLHAERAAIADAREAGYADQLRGSTAFVTLEPCCHHGKTLPCTDALIEIGVSRVVVATQDPFAKVAGKGIEQLRSNGIQVEVGQDEDAAKQLLAPYIKRTTQKLPWVIAKWAMSLDGRMATVAGDSQWISGRESRQIVHQIRSRVDAIVVGKNTALADDPLLTARLPDNRPPLRTAHRVVVDSRLAMAPTSQVVQTAKEFPTLIWAGPHADVDYAERLRQFGCQVEISSHDDRNERLFELLHFLADQRAATNVLFEGGSDLLGSLVDLKQIDECHVFIAPKIIGGRDAVSPIGGHGFPMIADTPHCFDIRHETVDDDVYFSCRVDWKTDP